ncbi:MAG: inositol monophosphatase [Halobacteriovoraceae bacterium]|jgi:myo-inositol-1(or 4)-monophosphatase|nr:inositol monophosphatase [Halobacteriovoraceae bacterium]MBT5094455.1 inositol monophosphatase [Halobacteriovoraceae bacterium]
MSNYSYPKILKELEEISIRAGKKLISRQKKLDALKVTYKQAQGLVSNADVESEKSIINFLRKRYSEIEFLAEESAFEKFKGKTEAYKHFQNTDYAWIIDPLDGTHNYLSGFDYFAICIALVKKGKPVVGSIYRPHTGEIFTAIAGKGAYKKILPNGRKVLLAGKKQPNKLKDSLMITGFSSEKGELFEREFTLFKKIMSKSRGVRRLGSAALDLCYVSQGVFDGFWEKDLAPWDVAAAGLIAQESGLLVSDFKGQKFHPFQNSILAASGILHRELRREF